ncbi:lipase family protein [Corynebacterium kalidii]|uniref:Lipase family protein n=1 Tax=Corynebacterium kalidii TaxID=2931982 RepID=A0A9X1WG76_9CORY|nr:lipase family protein [Corynebacterium kalidii]MCJ7857588.1 lipase family protein [Corynebacterium kalidii]
MKRTAGRTVGTALAAALVTVAAGLAAGPAAGPAQAQTLPWGGHAPRVEAGDHDPFYGTADLAPGTPGTVLRTASAPYAPAPSGPDGHQFAVPDRVQKMMYSTTDMDGRPVAVSGYTVEPTVPWRGPGERPTVVVGRGTVGQGDQCAPSRNWPLDNQPDPLDSGRTVALEGAYDWIFASQGVRVVVTDYVGMGTPGMHTYMNRAEQAHAMIDAARAARNLVEDRGEDFGAIGFYGHSQGGGASTAAVEAVADYAPDLDVAGAYASAPPADLVEVQRTIDGSNLVGAIGFAINGLSARYPALAAELDTHLSDHGRGVLDDLAGMCTDEIGDTYGYLTTDQWTADGRRLDDLLGEIPEGVRAMEEQRVGTGTPAAPTMIVSGRHDKTVAYGQARELAATWCSAGAPVVYRDDILPEISDQNHFLQAASGGAFGIPFLLDRFHGRPVGGTCSFPA